MARASTKAPSPPWTLTAAAAAAAAGTDAAAGLKSAEAARRLDVHGRNELARESATPLWRLVLAQFDDMLVKVQRRRGVERRRARRACARDREREAAPSMARCGLPKASGGGPTPAADFSHAVVRVCGLEDGTRRGTATNQNQTTDGWQRHARPTHLTRCHSHHLISLLPPRKR